MILSDYFAPFAKSPVGALGAGWTVPGRRNILRGHCGYARTCVYLLTGIVRPYGTPGGRQQCFFSANFKDL